MYFLMFNIAHIVTNKNESAKFEEKNYFNWSTLSHTVRFITVSDPAVGGTYMTLLNTLTNLGGKNLKTL
jgi:hypothetical protein